MAATAKVSPRQAARLLAGRDPVLARLVTEAGLPSFPKPTESHFYALVRSIVYQQLAGAAASAIHRRLIDALGGEVTPERILAVPGETLRAAGLSGNKLLSLQDLAAKVLDGTVPLSPWQLARESDQDIVARLSTVRGIGKWSAEMFLMFQLRRLDVWPTGDLAVRKGYGLGWDIPTPTVKQLDLLGEPYHPYRSVVAWYCWRAAQLYGGSRASAVTARPPAARKRVRQQGPLVGEYLVRIRSGQAAIEPADEGLPIGAAPHLGDLFWRWMRVIPGTDDFQDAAAMGGDVAFDPAGRDEPGLSPG
jgi:DNA-3-methyladenine glycosylase II